eukprot:TRINITY_DN3417_c0_g2_i1.p1 TRINITY_DN3417_c0_g2~~TRINITY_DN3417_c0_g2_i1.p1  ORF type:complete len:199 (-),score=35.09 TRINITY_DN3417_c0_g2_i1:45-641(-)
MDQSINSFLASLSEQPLRTLLAELVKEDESIATRVLEKKDKYLDMNKEAKRRRAYLHQLNEDILALEREWDRATHMMQAKTSAHSRSRPLTDVIGFNIVRVGTYERTGLIEPALELLNHLTEHCVVDYGRIAGSKASSEGEETEDLFSEVFSEMEEKWKNLWTKAPSEQAKRVSQNLRIWSPVLKETQFNYLVDLLKM